MNSFAQKQDENYCIDQPVVLPDAGACKILQKFLKKIKPDLQFCPADSMSEGIKGALAFSGDDDKLWFGWRFAQAVKEVVDVPADMVAEALDRCLDDRNWIVADDAKKMKVGFINYQLSKWLLFKIADVKNACSENPDLKVKMQAYMDAKERIFNSKDSQVKAKSDPAGA